MLNDLNLPRSSSKGDGAEQGLVSSKANLLVLPVPMLRIKDTVSLSDRVVRQQLAIDYG